MSSPRPPVSLDHPALADVRLVVSDLDGTLLDAGRVVAERTRQALRRVAAEGVTVVAATGRSHWTAVPRLAPIGVVRWIVCSNGSSLYDAEAGAVVDRTLLSSEACEAIRRLPTRLPGVGLGWEHGGGIHRDAGFLAIRQAEGMTMRPEEPVGELDLALGINKVMVGHRELGHDEILDAIRPLLPDDLEVSSSGASFVEVTAPGVEKGEALSRLSGRLGLDRRRAMAFGDQQNDLGMLGWAEFAYAMENAHPLVLAATDRRAPHHDDHGVAQVLESLT